MDACPAGLFSLEEMRALTAASSHPGAEAAVTSQRVQQLCTQVGCGPLSMHLAAAPLEVLQVE